MTAADMPAATTPPPLDLDNLPPGYHRDGGLILEDGEMGSVAGIVGRVDLDLDGLEYLSCMAGCLAEIQLADGGLCPVCRELLADSEDQEVSDGA